MKYIRTENGRIYKNNRKDIIVHDGYVSNYEQIIYHIDEKIIAQANTIEELCDEYVATWNDGKEHLPYHISQLEWREFAKELYLKTSHMNNVDTIYGAIWTDKGLIYVAKMNEKGELELL